jgi:hypothetical protein
MVESSGNAVSLENEYMWPKRETSEVGGGYCISNTVFLCVNVFDVSNIQQS